MNIENNKIETLKELLTDKTHNIIILGHTNPDGDAIGSMLAWGGVLEGQGHKVDYIVPNRFPYFLNWIEGSDKIHIYKDVAGGDIENTILNATLIFCMDFNSLSRIEALGESIGKNTTAKKILIDHHLFPDADYDIMFSYPEESSTCILTYYIITQTFGSSVLNIGIAEAMYVGIMTDTGGFSFSHLTPNLFRAVAHLLEVGIDIPQININVYSGYSAERIKLLGYTLNTKMELFNVNGVGLAYLSLSEVDMRRHNFQVGDSEGFVNYPLSIKTVAMSVMFTQTRQFIRVSFRSRGEVDVNQFAKKYFNGGGHRNASGGKSYKSLQETIKYFRECAKEHFNM